MVFCLIRLLHASTRQFKTSMFTSLEICHGTQSYKLHGTTLSRCLVTLLLIRLSVEYIYILTVDCHYLSFHYCLHSMVDSIYVAMHEIHDAWDNLPDFILPFFFFLLGSQGVHTID